MSLYADNISSIMLIFKNLEHIEIKREHIGHFYIDNIKRKIKTLAINSIRDILSAEYVAMEICADANQKNAATNDISQQLSFERILRHNDICQILIKKRGGRKNVRLYVPYCEDEYDNNINQKSKMNEFGDLYILISETADIDEELPDEILNDKHRRNSVWDKFDNDDEVCTEIPVKEENCTESAVEREERKKKARKMLINEITIEELDLSTRAANGLKCTEIDTVGDLILKTEEDLMKIKNFGRKSLKEVIHKLGMMGVSLKTDEI